MLREWELIQRNVLRNNFDRDLVSSYNELGWSSALETESAGLDTAPGPFAFICHLQAVGCFSDAQFAAGGIGNAAEVGGGEDTDLVLFHGLYAEAVHL